MNNDLFSKTLKEKRIAAGYSQSELSELLYLTRASYNHFETGKRTPTIQTILEMSSYLNINPMELISPLMPQDIKENLSVANNRDAKFISNYQKLSDSEKLTINNLVDMLNSAHSISIR